MIEENKEIHWKEFYEGWTAAMNGESSVGPYYLYPTDQSINAAWIEGYCYWVSLFG